jgi:hypothetical protein
MEIIIMQINQSYNNFDTQKTIQILKKDLNQQKNQILQAVRYQGFEKIAFDSNSLQIKKAFNLYI